MTSSSFAGTDRTDVAVGTWRLASMFADDARGRAAQRLRLVAVEHDRRGAVAARRVPVRRGGAAEQARASVPAAGAAAGAWVRGT